MRHDKYQYNVNTFRYRQTLKCPHKIAGCSLSATNVSRLYCDTTANTQVLMDPTKTCVVWINAGHELFQEARAQTTTLLEQCIAGYHEGNDVVYAMGHPEFASTALGGVGGNITSSRSSGASLEATGKLKNQRAAGVGRDTRDNVGGRGGGGDGGGGRADGRAAYEDEYIENVLSTMGDIESETRHRERGKKLRSHNAGGGGSNGSLGRGAAMEETEENKSAAVNSEMVSAWDGQVGEVYGSSWEHYRSSVAIAATNTAARDSNVGSGSNPGEEKRWDRDGNIGADNQRKGRRRRGGGGGGGFGGGSGDRVAGAQGRSIMVGTVLDASHPAFERQNNLVYGFGQGSKVYPEPEEFPEASALKEIFTKLKGGRATYKVGRIAQNHPCSTPYQYSRYLLWPEFAISSINFT